MPSKLKRIRPGSESPPPRDPLSAGNTRHEVKAGRVTPQESPFPADFRTRSSTSSSASSAPQSGSLPQTRHDPGPVSTLMEPNGLLQALSPDCFAFAANRDRIRQLVDKNKHHLTADTVCGLAESLVTDEMDSHCQTLRTASVFQTVPPDVPVEAILDIKSDIDHIGNLNLECLKNKARYTLDERANILRAALSLKVTSEACVFSNQKRFEQWDVKIKPFDTFEPSHQELLSALHEIILARQRGPRSSLLTKHINESISSLLPLLHFSDKNPQLGWDLWRSLVGHAKALVLVPDPPASVGGDIDYLRTFEPGSMSRESSLPDSLELPSRTGSDVANLADLDDDVHSGIASRAVSPNKEDFVGVHGPQTRHRPRLALAAGHEDRQLGFGSAENAFEQALGQELGRLSGDGPLELLMAVAEKIPVLGSSGGSASAELKLDGFKHLKEIEKEMYPELANEWNLFLCHLALRSGFSTVLEDDATELERAAAVLGVDSLDSLEENAASYERMKQQEIREMTTRPHGMDRLKIELGPLLSTFKTLEPAPGSSRLAIEDANRSARQGE